MFFKLLFGSIFYQDLGQDADHSPAKRARVETTAGSRVYRCKHCPYWARKVQKFHRHNLMRHRKGHAFRCTACALRANDRDSVRKHIAHCQCHGGTHEQAKVSPAVPIPNHRYSALLRYCIVPVDCDSGLIEVSPLRNILPLGRLDKSSQQDAAIEPIGKSTKLSPSYFCPVF